MRGIDSKQTILTINTKRREKIDYIFNDLFSHFEIEQKSTDISEPSPAETELWAIRHSKAGWAEGEMDFAIFQIEQFPSSEGIRLPSTTFRSW